uniref:cyd operon protein YbgE n=1 Tax=Vibrio cholerae TaxID=666 RepID=UPI003F5817D4
MTSPDKALLKALSLRSGFYNAAMVMWIRIVTQIRIGGFNVVIAPLMIWAICASMVFGVGFRPRHWVWQIVFSPYLSLTILSYLTLVQLIS